jgi:CCR4-NOT transcriptional complex subunit CAF120
MQAMRSSRQHSASSNTPLNLDGLNRDQQNGQPQPQRPFDQNPRATMGPPRSPALQSSPKISQDGSSIRSGSYTDSNQNQHGGGGAQLSSSQFSQQQVRDARSSPVFPSPKEPGMASPRLAQSQAAQLPTRRPSTVNPALSRVFEPLMDLIHLQSKKMYVCSPPEIEMIFARTPQGGPPKQGPPGSPRNDWDEVWMQLSGTSLSVWSMKETKEADQRGERVPPTYYNVTGE